MATAATINRKPQDLKNYSLALEISAEKLDKEFLENILKYGVQTPIVVCRSKKKELNGFIVKGHRRRMAALIHQGNSDPAVAKRFKTVPTLEWECNDRLEFETALILDNVTNERTNEERGRMYKRLLEIEKQQAQDAEVAAIDGKIESARAERNGKPSNGKAENKSRDRAAAAVGMSTSTARRASNVIDHADELREQGKTEEAKHLLDTMNNGSVNEAVREMEAEAPKAKAKVNPETDAIDKLVSKLTSQLSGAYKNLEELMLAFDKKKNNCDAFVKRHKRYETMAKQLGESLRLSKERIALLNEQWEGTREELT